MRINKQISKEQSTNVQATSQTAKVKVKINGTRSRESEQKIIDELKQQVASEILG
jgi:hypothetical protein